MPADPNTAACPVGYCWRCTVLDSPEGCNDLLCLAHKPMFAEEGQCQTLCDAGDDAGDAGDASVDAATSD